MMSRDEAAKIQLAEAHKYVQQFLTTRATFFGATIAAIGVLLGVIANLKDRSDLGTRLGVWAIVVAVHALGTQSVASATRAIWLFCCHMFMIERDSYGPGGNHQWLLSNLRSRQYSTTYGLYKAMIVLPVGTWFFLVADVIFRSDVHAGLRFGIVFIAAVVWGIVIWRTHVALQPNTVLASAAAQAISNERDIAEMERMTDEELRQCDRVPGPYCDLLLQHRHSALGRGADHRGRESLVEKHNRNGSEIV